MESLQAIKQRFEIIGNSVGLNRAIEKAMQVSATDISVLLQVKVGLVKKLFQKLHTNYLIENTQNL